MVTQSNRGKDVNMDRKCNKMQFLRDIHRQSRKHWSMFGSLDVDVSWGTVRDDS